MIVSLEQPFKTAANSLGATGQGVEDGKCLRDAILSQCPYYYALYDIMNNRASTNMLMPNTGNLDSSKKNSEDEASETEPTTEECCGLVEKKAATFVGVYASARGADNTSAVTPESVVASTSKPRVKSRKRSTSTPLSIGSIKKKRGHCGRVHC